MNDGLVQRMFCSPLAVRNRGGNVPREVFGQERHRLPLGAGLIAADAHAGAASEFAIDDVLAADAIVSRDERDEIDAIIADGERVARLVSLADTAVFQNR